MLTHDPFKRLMALRPPAPEMQAWWQQVCAEFSMAAGYNYNRQTGVVTVPDDTDLESRPSEPLGTIVQYIGADGTGVSTKLLPVSKTANLGSVINPLPLSAADAGTDTTITMSAFTAHFDFGNLSVSGASITGLAFSTFYYVYLTGFDYSDGSYTAALATTAATTLVNSPTQFYVGSITTPANGAGGTTGSGGGGAVVPGADIEP